MAVVLPLLLLLVFGIIDFGLMLNKQITLTAAAQEGARVLSLGGTEADARRRAEEIAGDDIAMDPGQTCDPVTGASGDARVTITNQFTFITPAGLIGAGFDGKVTLTGRGFLPCQ